MPFLGKDCPSDSSQFAHPDIVIGLTILAYRYEGLRSADFAHVITELKATLAMQLGPHKPLPTPPPTLTPTLTPPNLGPKPDPSPHPSP